MADKPMPNTEDGWRKQLTPEQYRVLREKGTEPPFTGEFLHAEADGTFTCALRLASRPRLRRRPDGERQALLH